MRIFKFACMPDDYKYLDVADTFFELKSQFQQRAFGKDWVPIPATLKSKPRRPMPNILCLNYLSPVFDPKALKSLKHLLPTGVELLPIDVAEHELVALNFVKSIDCFIESESDYRANRFGNIVEIYDGAFDESKLRDTGFFTIPERRGINVTEEAIQIMDDENLTGMYRHQIGRTVRVETSH